MSEERTQLTPEKDALAELIWNTSRADEGTISATGANIIARALRGAGYRITDECDACKGSGLCPNPSGYVGAPIEWLGCPDCMGAGRVFPPDKNTKDDLL